MATKVTPVKQDFYTEEVDYRSALSEQLMTKLASNVQFVHDRQMCIYDFRFNGPYAKLNGGEDGRIPLIVDIEIVGLAWSARQWGTSGTTQLDLHKINSSGADQGSLLSSNWIIAHNETDQRGFYKNFVDSTENAHSQAASNMPNISSANLNLSAGESLRLDIESNAAGANDLAVYVYYRPR